MFPEIKEASTKIHRPCELHQNYKPRLSEKLIGMYELLKADAKTTISEELVDQFKEINTILEEDCGPALKQPLAGKQ